MPLHHAAFWCATVTLMAAALPAFARPGPIVNAPAGAVEGQAQGSPRNPQRPPWA